MKHQTRRMLCMLLTVCLFLSVIPAKADGIDVKSLQKRLLELGYEIGTADGIIGKKTTAAVLLAQIILDGQRFDVELTGVPDEKTAELIMKKENSELLQTLVKGSWVSQDRNRMS